MGILVAVSPAGFLPEALLGPDSGPFLYVRKDWSPWLGIGRALCFSQSEKNKTLGLCS